MSATEFVPAAYNATGFQHELSAQQLAAQQSLLDECLAVGAVQVGHNTFQQLLLRMAAAETQNGNKQSPNDAYQNLVDYTHGMVYQRGVEAVYYVAAEYLQVHGLANG